MTLTLFSRSSRIPSALTAWRPSLSRLGMCLLAVPLLTTGCQHRDAIDTTRDVAHNIMGGEIRHLRPPTPGFDQPAPNIALTPTTTPEFPSREARAIITNRLEQDRNYSQRVAAAGGALPIGMVNPPPPHTRNGGSMTLNSQPSEPDTTQNIPSSTPVITPTANSGLAYQPIAHTVPVHLPDPGQPPQPIIFPGFAMPNTVRPVIPDFDTTTPAGTLFRFQADTDHLVGDQTKAFTDITAHRRHHRLLIRGFGTTLDAQSGLSPDEQTREINLALLRARAIAQRLAILGVPESDMRLTGEPIGDGVRVSYEMNTKPAPASSY